MQHIIIGYGYCGRYLADALLTQQQSVTAIARCPTFALQQPRFTYLSADITQTLPCDLSDAIVYYLIPPPPTGQKDTTLSAFLAHCKPRLRKLVYFGASSVYGHHNGQWVDEQSSCYIQTDRQHRRLDAEHQCHMFSQKYAIPCAILRVAGIYGAHRLPITAIKQQQAVVNPQEAPFSNLIYVQDLARIAAIIGTNPNINGIFNLADGMPQKMYAMQLMVRTQLGLAPPNFISLAEALAQASPMMREFLTQSKRLSVDKLAQALDNQLQVTSLAQAVKASLAEMPELGDLKIKH
mgnify:FL=1